MRGARNLREENAFKPFGDSHNCAYRVAYWAEGGLGSAVGGAGFGEGGFHRVLFVSLYHHENRLPQGVVRSSCCDPV